MNKLISELEDVKLRIEAFFDPEGNPPENTGEFCELKGAIKMLEYVIRSLEDRHAKVEDPLAVLADRKGWYVQDILPPIKACPGWEINLCSKEMNKESVYDKVNCDAPTYAECEAKARAYLEGLDGVKGGR